MEQRNLDQSQFSKQSFVSKFLILSKGSESNSSQSMKALRWEIVGPVTMLSILLVIFIIFALKDYCENRDKPKSNGNILKKNQRSLRKNLDQEENVQIRSYLTSYSAQDEEQEILYELIIIQQLVMS